MDSSETAINRESSKFMLRFPNGLRQKIKEMAANNRRSMNAELIIIIEKGIKSVDGAQNVAH